MMPNYRDGWTVGKTDYMIYAPKGAKMEGKVFIRGREADEAD